MTSLLTHPALRGDRLLFVSEDDLWSVDARGGVARRLTSALGAVRTPQISHDGQRVAVSAAEDGARELYLMDADGGALERRTWLGGELRIAGFTPDDREVVVCTGADHAHSQELRPYALEVARPSVPRLLPLGTAVRLAWQVDGPGVALCRHVDDLGRWQRYRGGRVGQIWVDATGSGRFDRLPTPVGNVASPFWFTDELSRSPGGPRVGFVSDHTGWANLHSVRPDGSDLRQHTTHDGFVVRFPTCDAGAVVYVLGGDLWRLDLASGSTSLLPIRTHGPRTQAQRRFPTVERYVEHLDLHPEGHSMVLTARGQTFAGGLWEGPLVQLGGRSSERHRLAGWLDADRVLRATDAGGVDHLEVHDLRTRTTRSIDAVKQRVDALIPHADGRVAFVGPHTELGVFDLASGAAVPIARGEDGPPTGVTWSPDGRWLVWSEPMPAGRARIRLARMNGLDVLGITDVTDGRYRDRSPDFDPLGRYLYFLSDRELDPVRDGIYFGYHFPRGSRPYLVTLRADAGDPRRPPPRPLGKAKAPREPEQFDIELDGIQDRVVRFPVVEGRYTDLAGLPSGRVLLQRAPVSGTLGQTWAPSGPPEALDELLLWDFEGHELTVVQTRITGFRLDRPRKTAAVRAGWKWRVLPADPDKGQRAELKRLETAKPGRKSGWVDPARARLAVDPPAEWHQMLHETWRLMRDHFWDAGMSGHDWQAVGERWLPLVDRVATRAELSDLVWCMQGALGASHAYEVGGDHRSPPSRAVGRLAADLTWDEDAWRVERLHAAEPGDPERCSPLIGPGAGARPGTRIHTVDGVPVDAQTPLHALLVGATDRSVQLELSHGDGPRRQAWVQPLADDTGARLRSWVAANRERVHELTGGRAGYVHAQDMGPAGFADFHRDYLAESNRSGLLVDIRYNRGGHVSQLLLNRLVQRRAAYVVSRSHGIKPWPNHSVGGPMVALCNEYSGSDGDIFTHSWKELGLGPVVGTRTWGGVIGISPRRPLVDRAITTQPEFAYWFANGTGYDVENQGVMPDIEVVVPPHAQGDPQLDRALEVLVERLDAAPPPVTPRA